MEESEKKVEKFIKSHKGYEQPKSGKKKRKKKIPTTIYFFYAVVKLKNNPHARESFVKERFEKAVRREFGDEMV